MNTMWLRVREREQGGSESLLSPVSGPKAYVRAGGRPNRGLGHRSSPFTVPRAGPTNIDTMGG